MLEKLFIKSRDFININNLEYKRYFIKTKHLEHRLSIIIGSRGIGKTTTVAQYIKKHYKNSEALYVNLDDIENTSKYTMTHIAEEMGLTVGNLKAKYYPSSINKWLLADEIKILKLYGDK